MEEGVSMLNELGISEETINFLHQKESELKECFNIIDNNCLYNSTKVLNAFHEECISDYHFNSTKIIW